MILLMRMFLRCPSSSSSLCQVPTRESLLSKSSAMVAARQSYMGGRDRKGHGRRK